MAAQRNPRGDWSQARSCADVSAGGAVTNLDVFKAALKHFGRITPQNAGQVREWIRQERERLGVDSPHYEAPANVQRFEPRADLSDPETGEGGR